MAEVMRDTASRNLADRQAEEIRALTVVVSGAQNKIEVFEGQVNLLLANQRGSNGDSRRSVVPKGVRDRRKTLWRHRENSRGRLSEEEYDAQSFRSFERV